MGLERNDVVTTPSDAYRALLESRLALLSNKAWTELTPEEKDLVLEAYAFRLGIVRAPG